MAPTATVVPTGNPSTAAPAASSTIVSSTAGADDSACLHGKWIVPDAALDDYFDAVQANTGFDSIESTGTIALSFTATEFQWTNDYALVVAIGPDSYDVTQSGTVAGTYASDDDVLSGIVVTDSRAAELSQEGGPIDGDVGDLFVGLAPARPMDDLAFSCDGPTIAVPAGPAPGDVAILTLRPA